MANSEESTVPSENERELNRGCLYLIILFILLLLLSFFYWDEIFPGETELPESVEDIIEKIVLPIPGVGEVLLEYEADGAIFSFIVPEGTQLNTETSGTDTTTYFNYPGLDVNLFVTQDPLPVGTNCEAYNEAYLKGTTGDMAYKRIVHESGVEGCMLGSPVGSPRYLNLDVPYGGVGYGVSWSNFEGTDTSPLPTNGYLQLPTNSGELGPVLIFEDGFETGDTSVWSLPGG